MRLGEAKGYKWIEALSQTHTRTPEGVEVNHCQKADVYEFFVEAKASPFVTRRTKSQESRYLW